MKKRELSILAGCVAIAATIGVTTITAQNKNDRLVVDIPNAGIAKILDNYNAETQEAKAGLTALITNTVALASNDVKAKTIEDKTTGGTATNSTTAAETTQAPTQASTQEQTQATTQETTTVQETTQEQTTEEPSYYDTIAMSQVDNYVNVRSVPSTDGEIVGKIYNNCAATIVATEGEWYKIESGNVSGYIKSEYFITGDAAEAKALECRNVFATVTTEVLNVRSGQGTDCELLTQLPLGGVFDVIEYGDGWVYLEVDGDVKGWVSMDYVDISVHFDTAVTLEEEQAKLEEERRLAEEAEEAARIAREAKKAEDAARAQEEEARRQQEAEDSANAVEEYIQAEESGSASAMRNAVVAYALQFVGNPYVYGGTSLTNGTDCSGFTMSVYSNFGYGLNRTSTDQSYNGAAVSMDNLQPGDLLFYSNGGSGIGHVALYIGGGQVVHASTPATGIKISDVNYRTPITARRIIR